MDLVLEIYDACKLWMTIYYVCIDSDCDKMHCLYNKKPISFAIMSVCLSSCISAAASGWIYVKFDIGDVYENVVEKIQIWLKSDKNGCNFT